MQYIRKTAKIILLLLSPAVIVLFYNNVDNKHSHILPSGEIIEHAHPYKANNNSHNPVQNHKHTNSFILLLHIINSAISTVLLLLFFILKTNKYLLNVIFNKIIVFIKLFFLQSINNRAPPFSFSLSKIYSVY